MIDDVDVRPSGDKGLGVFARRAFRKGEFIFRRRHVRILTESELATATEWERMHLEELDFDRYAVLAAPGCYLNHSCEPNAMRHGVTVFAWRDIDVDEEITIEYRLNAYDDDSSSPCCCGAASCTGTIVGSFFAMSPERQHLLLPHAPTFIRREYQRRARERGGEH